MTDNTKKHPVDSFVEALEQMGVPAEMIDPAAIDSLRRHCDERVRTGDTSVAIPEPLWNLVGNK